MRFGYFENPFPGTQGFSPYRFPGLLVHIPVWLGFLIFGYQLNANQVWLLPACVGYFILGLYLGRDLAVLAHYNIYILMVVLFLAFAYLPWISPWFAALQQYRWFPMISIMADGLCFVGFVVYAGFKGGRRP
jgi:hypothetical protein